MSDTPLSPCFAALRRGNAEVFAETAGRRGIPTSLLVQGAMQSRGIPYDASQDLENNCLKLLEALKLSLADEAAASLEVEAADAQAAAVQALVEEAVPDAPLIRKPKRPRPPMHKPEFLIPVVSEVTSIVAPQSAEEALSSLLELQSAEIKTVEKQRKEGDTDEEEEGIVPRARRRRRVLEEEEEESEEPRLFAEEEDQPAQ